MKYKDKEEEVDVEVVVETLSYLGVVGDVLMKWFSSLKNKN